MSRLVALPRRRLSIEVTVKDCETMSPSNVHETAFNLARRLSARNEPDLLQEDMMSDGEMTPPGSPFTKKYCFSVLDKVCPDSPLPSECKKYEEVVVALQRKNSNRSAHAIAFQGMNAGEAAAAAAARERGQLHHAQIQRRLTNSKNRKLWG